MIQHYEPSAAVVGECPECSGPLRFVDDPGSGRPVEAQCESCGVLTGIAVGEAPKAASDPDAWLR